MIREEKWTGKEKVVASILKHSTSTATSPSAPGARTGRSCDHITGGLNSVLEQRFQLLKRPLGVSADTYLRQPEDEGCSSSKKVLWADLASLALTQLNYFI